MNEHPILSKLLTALRAGDTFVVCKLDRLGSSLKDLVELVTNFQERGIHFVSLQDNLNTTMAQGQLILNVFSLLAEFERDLVQDRTNASLVSARARGRQGGRPKGLSKDALSKAEAAKMLYLQRDKTVGEIGKLLGIGRATVYRYLEYLGVPTGHTSSTPPANFKFKDSESSADLITELDTAIQELTIAQPKPVDLFASKFVREFLIRVSVSSPFPNEMTAWCFARRSPSEVLNHHENLHEVARENEVDTDELADRISTLCGGLYYLKLKGKWTRADRHLADKMNY